MHECEMSRTHVAYELLKDCKVERLGPASFVHLKRKTARARNLGKTRPVVAIVEHEQTIARADEAREHGLEGRGPAAHERHHGEFARFAGQLGKLAAHLG